MGLFSNLFGGNNSEPEKSTADMDDAEFAQWVADKKGTGQRYKELTTQGLSPTEADLKIQNEQIAKAIKLQQQIERNKEKVRDTWQMGDDGRMRQVSQSEQPKRTRTRTEWQLIDGKMEQVTIDEEY